MIKTKAEPLDDGSYAITGTKIFITGGEQDITDNIVHLVLAKIPGGPEGVKGISLFLVPKFLPDENGEVGQRNNVKCGSIEDKMGLKGSATCVMNFDGAKGWLVGPENKGMRGMFIMMNAARMGVGIQGLGILETSYQSAFGYAKERVCKAVASQALNRQTKPRTVSWCIQTFVACFCASRPTLRVAARWRPGYQCLWTKA